MRLTSLMNTIFWFVAPALKLSLLFCPYVFLSLRCCVVILFSIKFFVRISSTSATACCFPTWEMSWSFDLQLKRSNFQGWQRKSKKPDWQTQQECQRNLLLSKKQRGAMSATAVSAPSRDGYPLKKSKRFITFCSLHSYPRLDWIIDCYQISNKMKIFI